MPERCAKRILLSAIAAASGILLLSGLAAAQQASPEGVHEPEMASRGQRGLVRQINYGDWQKFCFKTPGSSMVCRTTISGTWDTGQTAVRVDLIEREGEGTARLQFFVPVGMYLQAGIKLRVDQGKPHQIPYVSCMTNTCIAGSAADPQLVSEMEKGEKLVLEVVDSSVQSVSTTLPLKQFALARKGTATQTYRQDIDE